MTGYLFSDVLGNLMLFKSGSGQRRQKQRQRPVDNGSRSESIQHHRAELIRKIRSEVRHERPVRCQKHEQVIDSCRPVGGKKHREKQNRHDYDQNQIRTPHFC